MVETVIMRRQANTKFAAVGPVQQYPYPTVDYWIGVLQFEDNITLRKVAVLKNGFTVYHVEGTSTYFGVRQP